MTYKRAALVWLLQSAQRREFRYIYKPEGNPSRTRGHTFLFVFLMKGGISMKLKEVLY